MSKPGRMTNRHMALLASHVVTLGPNDKMQLSVAEVESMLAEITANRKIVDSCPFAINPGLNGKPRAVLLNALAGDEIEWIEAIYEEKEKRRV